jgi:hypothetical protein
VSRPVSRRGRCRAVVALVLVLPLAVGCVSLPDEGPVREAPGAGQRQDDAGVQYAPRPPQRNESARQIVEHFLQAMQAVPVDTTTAGLFLTEEAREQWRPSRRVITYAGIAEPRGQVELTVELQDAHWLDARGVWQGPLPESESVLDLPVTLQDGEYRIARAPDALVVPETWFRDQYRQVSLYFFDPSAEILVPEPVFVPRSAQLATVLVRGLLQGPPQRGVDAATSFFPPGTSLADVAVPVDDDGVAEVALDGKLGNADQEGLELMAAQLAWTLRQDPGITAVRVTIGGTPVTLPGGSSAVPVSFGAQHAPDGMSTTSLYGLQEGRLVRVEAGEALPVTGPLGNATGVREIAVDPSGDTVAAVSDDGTRLLVGPVEQDDERVLTAPISGGNDLVSPSWDALDRLWVADRGAGGARLWVHADGRTQQVEVPGVTGADIRDLTVSRDGTRLVAALDRRRGDVVVVSRLAWTASGVRASPARVVESGSGRPLSIRDVAWRSPTELVVLISLRSPRGGGARALSEVRRVPIDGSPVPSDGAPPVEVIRADARSLVSSPSADSPAWVVVAGGGLVQLAPLVTTADLPGGIRHLTYPG